MADRFVIDFEEEDVCSQCYLAISREHVLCGICEQRIHPYCFKQHKEEHRPHCYACLKYLKEEEIAKEFGLIGKEKETWCYPCYNNFYGL